MENRIVFYNMYKLIELAKNRNKDILSYFELYAKGSKYYPKFINLAGYSYLINSKDLIESNTADLYKAQYLYLASFRLYSEYLLFNTCDLLVSNIPDISKDMYTKNPLLLVEEGLIKFKYENN